MGEVDGCRRLSMVMFRVVCKEGKQKQGGVNPRKIKKICGEYIYDFIPDVLISC